MSNDNNPHKSLESAETQEQSARAPAAQGESHVHAVVTLLAEPWTGLVVENK